MKNKQIALNAIVSVVQTIISGITLFVLYRYLLDNIGIEQMGVWSVVLATTAASRISEMGLSGGVIKFVAQYKAREQSELISLTIETAAVSVTLFISVAILLSFYPFKYLLQVVIPETGLAAALEIFPYALLSFLILAVGSIFQSGLEGCQRIDIKGYILILSSVSYLFITFVLVPEFGLLGLAYAQVIQSVMILILSFVWLRIELPQLPLIRFRWNRSIFNEMIGYCLNIQVTSIVQMLFEPMTKAMLSKFGGLEMVGFFEMANRMIMQFRTLLVSANRVLVPVIAELQEISPNRIQEIYSQSYRLLLYLSVPFFGGLVALTPMISELWIGHYEEIFILFCLLSITGWFFSTLSGPAYFGYMGSGRLRWNTLSHILIGIINGLAGLIFGSIYGGVGVVVAWLVALVLGSAIIPFNYHRENKIPYSFLFPLEFLGLLLSTLLGMGLAWFAYFQLQALNAVLLFSIGGVVFMVPVLVAAWFHPIKDTIMTFFKKKTTVNL